MKIIRMIQCLAGLFFFNACSESEGPIYLENSLSKADYAFGIEEIIAIKSKVYTADYQAANELINGLSSDYLSHVFDCLALNLNETVLLKWHSETGESAAASLALGVFYGHKGWLTRTNAYADEVAVADALDFYGYQKKSSDLLKTVATNPNLKAEAYSRLIRVAMSLEDEASRDDFFKTCVQTEPLQVWAYIHQLEAVQPKWGGSQAKVEAFLANIPDQNIIQTIVKLKLILDGSMEGVNFYTGKPFEQSWMKSEALKMDEYLSSLTITSPFRFLMYGYMALIFQELGETALFEKYFGQMEGHYTLYPFGITITT